MLIAVEIGGESSMLGEVWFAEADTPLGPWAYARKVATHDRYSFYNPQQHPEFAKQSGRMIFFEGTYTVSFSGNTNPTPRYDYNQVMYKLDLDDPRLDLPVPISSVEGRLLPRSPGHWRRFFALERPRAGTVPIGEPATCYGLPVDLKNPPKTTTILYEQAGEGGAKVYNPDEPRTDLGPAKAIARVWRNPMQVVLPPE